MQTKPPTKFLRSDEQPKDVRSSRRASGSVQPCAAAPMRVVKRVVDFSARLFSEALFARSAAIAERSRARSGGTNCYRALPVRALICFTCSSSKQFLSPPGRRGSSQSASREPARPVSPRSVVPDDVVLHQLLSGQLRQSSTPTVSYLLDCGDRGLRPF